MNIIDLKITRLFILAVFSTLFLFSCMPEDETLRDMEEIEIDPDRLPEPKYLLDADRATRHNMTSSAFQNFFEEFARKGYRLIQIDGYNVEGQVRYAAIWEKATGPAYLAHHGMSGKTYQQKFNDYTSKGYRLVWVDGHEAEESHRYNAIWEKVSGPGYFTHHGMSFNNYEDKMKYYINEKGLRLTHVNVYGVGNDLYYNAIWEDIPGPGYYTKPAMTLESFVNHSDMYAEQGFILSHLSSTHAGNTDYYAAIWEKKTSPGYVVHVRQNTTNYQHRLTNMYYQHFNLEFVSGNGFNGQSNFAAVWVKRPGGLSLNDMASIDQHIQKLMADHAMNGVSIAITKDERLVYAKGFGYADVQKGEILSPTHLMRVASVAKPFTSVAIMKLVEDGLISLNDPVFGSNGILGTSYYNQPLNWHEFFVTVQDLLDHTAGGVVWDNGNSGGFGDPMFQYTNLNHQQLIAKILDDRVITVKPGEVADYSNFGYCVLGRIVEQVTGMSYEQYVKQNILNIAKVKDMHVAGNTLAQRRPNEVRYNHTSAYNMKVDRMDAHGGWIASPIELVKFLAATDGQPNRVDILNTQTRNTMFMPSTADPAYSLGWMVSGSDRGHNGSLPGTGAWMKIKGSNGIGFAILTNDKFSWDLNNTMEDIIANINSWPALDKF